MKKIGGKSLLSVLFVLGVLLPVFGWAFEVPAQKGLVNDYAGFLTKQEIASLEKKSSAAAVRVIIVTNTDVAENNAKMARAFFDQWKLKGNDVLAIFSGSGKGGAYYINPGQDIAGILTDSKIKAIRTDAQSLLVKSRTGEALQLTIDSVDKEIRSAAHTKTLVRTIILVLLGAGIAFAVVVYLNKSAARRRDRKEIEDGLNGVQASLLDVAEKVGTYTKMIGMLSAESRTHYESTLSLISSSGISVILKKIDGVRANIGKISQDQLLGSCARLKNESEKINEAFALVDRLINDDSVPQAKNPDSSGASPVERSSGNFSATGASDHASETTNTTRQPSEYLRQRGSAENDHADRTARHDTVVRETYVRDTSGPNILILGDMGGHHNYHDHSDRSTEDVRGHVSRETDESDFRGGGLFSVDSVSHETDERGGHFSAQPDPVIADPFVNDDRGGSFATNTETDDRGGSFTMESPAEVQESSTGSTESSVEESESSTDSNE